MRQKFYQVMISSELRTQGLRLLEHLIAKRLIFGGPVFNGPARLLWLCCGDRYVAMATGEPPITRIGTLIAAT